MKSKGCKQWTMKEIKYLLDNSGNITVAMACSHLGRSVSSIHQKGSALGIEFVHKSKFYEYAYYSNDELVTVGTVEEISECTGISTKQLLMYRYESIKKNYRRSLIKLEDELLEKIV